MGKVSLQNKFMLADRSTLAIWLTARERATILAQLAGRVSVLDVQNVSMLTNALAAGQAHAVLASAAMLDAASMEQLTRLRRTFPRVPLVGLVTHDVVDGIVWRAAALGRLGADAVADIGTGRDGWSTLNRALARLPTPLVARALAAVHDVLGPDGTSGWFHFLAEAFRGEATTVKDIALASGDLPANFYNRFSRLGLPSPRRYVEIGLLARLAYLSDTTMLSTTAISRAANASSPQAFNTAVRRLTGLTPHQWRQGHGLGWLLNDFCDRLIKPYCVILRTFDPFRSAPT